MSIVFGALFTSDALRRRTAWVLQLLAFAAVAVLGVVERARDPAYAIDRTLFGVAFGFLAPLLFLAMFEIVHKKERTSAIVAPLARHGQSRRALAAGLLGGLALACAAAGGALGFLAALSTESPTRDLFACTWGGAAIGAAYAGLYAVGSLRGRWGRIAALALDWVFGSGAGYLALPFPRSNARSLLGGEPVIDAPQMIALAILLGLTFAGVMLSALRAAR
jgi:hypothetical protein